MPDSASILADRILHCWIGRPSCRPLRAMPENVMYGTKNAPRWIIVSEINEVIRSHRLTAAMFILALWLSQPITDGQPGITPLRCRLAFLARQEMNRMLIHAVTAVVFDVWENRLLILNDCCRYCIRDGLRRSTAEQFLLQLPWSARLRRFERSTASSDHFASVLNCSLLVIQQHSFSSHLR